MQPGKVHLEFLIEYKLKAYLNVSKQEDLKIGKGEPEKSVKNVEIMLCKTRKKIKDYNINNK